MDEVKSRKLQALQKKQDLDRLIELYGEFQGYIEEFAAWLRNKKDSPEMLKRHEALRLHLSDKEARFLEWHQGQQILNRAVFSLVRDPDPYQYNLNDFQCDVLLATEKFEYLIRKQEKSLRELHEQIALLTSEEEAHKVTSLESPSRLASTADNMAKADKIVDTSLKWGGHIIRFAPWAKDVLRAFGLWP